jgi:hypothetical protein
MYVQAVNCPMNATAPAAIPRLAARRFHDSHEITQVRTHVRRNTGQHDRLSNHDKQCHRRRNGESETPADEAAEELSRRQPYHRPAPPR